MVIKGMYQEGTVEEKIELLAMVQMSILDYLMDDDRFKGNNPPDLLRGLLAGTMAHDRLRTDLPSLHLIMHQTVLKHLLWNLMK